MRPQLIRTLLLTTMVGLAFGAGAVPAHADETVPSAPTDGPFPDGPPPADGQFPDAPEEESLPEDESTDDPEGVPGRDVPDRAPTICDAGSSWIVINNVKKNWKLTHAEMFENATDSTPSKTISVKKVWTLKASASFTQGGGASADVLIAKLEGKTDLNLQAAGEVTNERSESVTWPLKAWKTYVFYSGVKHVTGKHHVWQCRAGKPKEVGTGTTQSWSIRTEGAVLCGASVKAGTAAKLAQKYCD